MKKILVFIPIMLVSIAITNAFSIQMFGYEINYNTVQNVEIVDKISNEQLQTHKFNEYVEIVNNDIYAQKFLRELGYSRVGVIDKDTNNEYTIIIDTDGKISEILNGLHNVEITIICSKSTVEYYYSQEDYIGLYNSLEIPLKLKLKILWMRIF